VIALIQRVSEAKVVVDTQTLGAINGGLLVLLGVERGDGESQCQRLLDKVLAYRIFADAQGRMNRSLRDVAGQLLVVPQFTLAADTRSGLRPSFTPAAAPADAEFWYQEFVRRACASHVAKVATGRFGAHMHVSLLNDGPVTFWLQCSGAA